jgi:hypothetical protein
VPFLFKRSAVSLELFSAIYSDITENLCKFVALINVTPKNEEDFYLHDGRIDKYAELRDKGS